MSTEVDGDLYSVLGLTYSFDDSEESSITKAHIRKAYRNKALECHPDKRPGDKNAAAEFDRIQKAYEVLNDESAREAYDRLMKVKHQRLVLTSRLDARRQKMVADLNAREGAANTQKREEDTARDRLKAELERLKKQAAEQRKSSMAKRVAPDSTPAAAAPSDKDSEELARTLKVSWLGDSSAYSVGRLKALFEEFGAVDDVVVRRVQKKSNKTSALVVMASYQAAVAATQVVCGDLSNPLLVLPAKPETAPVSQVQGSGSGLQTHAAGTNPLSGDSFPFAMSSTAGSAYRDYESMTLLRMKQAGQRARLEKQVLENDRKEDETIPQQP